jgi:hypothetical protein
MRERREKPGDPLRDELETLEAIVGDAGREEELPSAETQPMSESDDRPPAKQK